MCWIVKLSLPLLKPVKRSWQSVVRHHLKSAIISSSHECRSHLFYTFQSFGVQACYTIDVGDGKQSADLLLFLQVHFLFKAQQFLYNKSLSFCRIVHFLEIRKQCQREGEGNYRMPPVAHTYTILGHMFTTHICYKNETEYLMVFTMSLLILFLLYYS